MTTKHKHAIKLAEFWPYKAVFLAEQVSKFTLSIAREAAGLNLSQWRVLAAVAEKPGRTAADVTTVTPMDKTIVSRAVQSLITLELIEKTPDAHDKRRMTLRPTLKGSKAYKNIAAQLNAAFTPNSKQDADAQQLLALLDEFIKRMDAVTPAD